LPLTAPLADGRPRFFLPFGLYGLQQLARLVLSLVLVAAAASRTRPVKRKEERGFACPIATVSRHPRESFRGRYRAALHGENMMLTESTKASVSTSNEMSQNETAPSADEIARRVLAIRASWGLRERISRRRVGEQRLSELLDLLHAA